MPPLCGLPAAVVVGAASGLTPIEREYDHWHSPQQKTAARLSLTLGGEGTWRLCETHQLVTKQGFAGELVVDTAVTLTHAATGGCRTCSGFGDDAGAQLAGKQAILRRPAHTRARSAACNLEREKCRPADQRSAPAVPAY